MSPPRHVIGLDIGVNAVDLRVEAPGSADERRYILEIDRTSTLLSDLTVFPGELTEPFNPETGDTVAFDMTPGLGNPRLTATPEDPGASVSIDGIEVIPGEPVVLGDFIPHTRRLVEVIVVGRNGTSRTYTVRLEGNAWSETATLETGHRSETELDGVGASFGLDAVGPWVLEASTGAASLFRIEGDAWLRESVRVLTSDVQPLSGALSSEALVLAAWQARSHPGPCVGDCPTPIADYGDARLYDPAEVTVPLGQARSHTEGDKVGRSVAADGGTVAVGVFGDDGGAENAGAVWVFERREERWGEPVTLRAEAPVPGDYFSSDLALSDDVLAVSSISAVYLFERIGDAWIQRARLVLPPQHQSLANRVALDDDVLVLCLPNGDEGVCEVRRRQGARWASDPEGRLVDPVEATLRATDGLADAPVASSGRESFGRDCALANGLIVVAAEDHVFDGRDHMAASEDMATYHGAVHVYAHVAGNWQRRALLGPPVPGRPAESEGSFGKSVAATDQRIVVAGPGEGFRDVLYVFEPRP